MAVTDPIVPSSATLSTTIDSWIRKVTDAAMSKHRFLSMLKEKGRIIYNCTGYNFKWPVQKDRPRSVPYTRLSTISSPQRDLHTTAELPLRARVFSGSIDEFSKLANRGSEAIVNHWKVLLSEAPKAIMRDLGEDFLQVDGNATGYTDRIHGIPSCTAGSGEVNSKWAISPGDTYAGLSTTLGNYGGTATDFPLNGSEKACFWSPILGDYANDALSGTSHTWKLQWREILDLTNTYLQERQSVGVDTWLMPPDMLLDAKRAVESLENVFVSRGKDESLAAKLGYESISYSGVDLVSDQDMPASTVYGLVWDNLSLRCCYPQLIKQFKQDEITTLSSAATFAFFGNARIETPAQVIKIADYSS